MKRAIIALGLLTSAVASPADAADLLDWTTYCNSGQTLTTCASVKITTASNGSGGTLVNIFVRNLSGDYAGDNTVSSILTKLALLNTGIGAYIGGTLSVTADGVVGVAGSPGSQWAIGGTSPEIGEVEILATSGNSGPGDPKRGGIEGCVLTGSTSVYFQTCASGGNPGSVKFSFETSSRWYAADALISYKVQSAGADNEESLECVTAGDKQNCFDEPPFTEIPEPATMVLLATGLIGLAGAQYRRRKNNKV